MKIKIVAKNKPGLKDALNILLSLNYEVELISGVVGDSFPHEKFEDSCDLLISYMSPWIIPGKVLEKVKKYCINFHPGPPEYPGIGCTNFALYNYESKFGVTCHFMLPKVDSGGIISVKRFPIYDNDNVETLSERCYENILIQFQEVIFDFHKNGELHEIDEKWKKVPYTRKQLNELSVIELPISEEELSRKIRATYFKGYPFPFIKINGVKFVYYPE